LTSALGICNVILADDHPLLLRGLEDIVADDQSFAVVGVSSDGTSALAQIRQMRPHLAVLDIIMPGLSGLEIAKAIAAEGLPSRVILLSALISDEQVVQALTAGVSGILLKESAPDQFMDCLHAVASGGKWLPEDIIERALTQQAEQMRRQRGLRETITAREREIAELVCQGESNSAIAEKLGLSPGTVRIHLHNIYMKLNVKNRTALTALILRTPDQ
jgi:two-component system nitrate/nitrite response regulator NarL